MSQPTDVTTKFPRHPLNPGQTIRSVKERNPIPTSESLLTKSGFGTRLECVSGLLREIYVHAQSAPLALRVQNMFSEKKRF